MLNVMRNAAMAISANNMIDSGTKQVDYDVCRFDKSFEEFFSLIDQLEVHLRTSIECLNQSGQSAKYLPVPVTPNKTDNSMTYPQYIELVKGQIAYAKEIHGALTEASQRMCDS
ncbi:Mediator of RNA polymerase II transcription subunit 29 [Orchesella cincta]|uniref:Mediator of RNA polymerase II transcription subunit 29 n=1 Tax=Orchesella cincta TaxID=48709 RepID=A0A1D2MFH7_ORCCI|nr:Mediator of RNA polymerase II transcription subunit 29 [Orchesella cincta]